MTAGMARIRPILITASTTVIAMFPLAMGKAEFVSAIGATFAITVIGGLTLSTLLTLIFIPTFYSGLENALEWFKSLDWKNKVIQLLFSALLIFLIYTHIDKFIWKLITTILAVILVPAATWFVMNSLRKARETVIPADESINIYVQSLVKIYERENRWAREWKAGARIRERLGLNKHFRRWKDMTQVSWQLPSVHFYDLFHLFLPQKGILDLPFQHCNMVLPFSNMEPVQRAFHEPVMQMATGKFLRKLIPVTDFIVFWIIPLSEPGIVPDEMG